MSVQEIGDLKKLIRSMKMKRKRLIAIVAALAALALVVTGATAVLAHDPETGESGCWGRTDGFFQGNGRYGFGSGEYPGLEDYETCFGIQEHYSSGWINGYRIGMFRHALVEELAENLGLTYAELMEDIQAGQTIAQIAESQGIDVDTLIDAALVPYAAMIDRMVADGYLDSEEAVQLLAETRARLEQIAVNDWYVLEKSWCGYVSAQPDQGPQGPDVYGKAFSRGCCR